MKRKVWLKRAFGLAKPFWISENLYGPIGKIIQFSLKKNIIMKISNKS